MEFKFHVQRQPEGDNKPQSYVRQAQCLDGNRTSTPADPRQEGMKSFEKHDRPDAVPESPACRSGYELRWSSFSKRCSQIRGF